MILLVSYVVAALYCGSLGIFASSFMKRSTFSNVITYGILLVVVVGTYMLNVFLFHVSETEISMMSFGAGDVIPEASSGSAVYLLLINPAIMFAELLENQVAGGGGNFTITRFLGDNGGNFITSHWVFCSLVIQAVLSVAFIWGAVVFLNPERYGKKGSHESFMGTGTEVIDMFYIGCHLSSAKGFLAMGKDAEKIGATTFQFFTRNPPGWKR